MSLFVERPSMFFTFWIEVCSSSRAAFSQVSELVNMDSMFTVWVEPFDHNGNFYWAHQIFLVE